MNKQSINRLSQQKLKRRPPASFLPDGPLDHAADLAATVWAAISAGTPPAAALATSLDTAASLGVSPSAAETAALAAAVSAATLPSSAELAADTVHVVSGLDGGAPTQRCGGTEDAAFNAWLDAGAPTCNEDLVQMGLPLRCFTPREMLAIVLGTEPDSAIVNFIDGSRKNEPAYHAPAPRKTESSAGQHTCGAPPHCSEVDEIISGVHQAWFERGGQSKFACLELFNACVDGRLEGELGVKQLLVVQEPDIFVTIDDCPSDEFKTTALCGAIVYGQLEAMRLLLAHGADPNLADSDGMTPLMLAASCGRVLAVKELMARGAYLNTRHPRGSTAFHEACIHNKPKCAALLVKLGCDRTLQTNDGRTGEQLAQARGHRKVCAAVAGTRTHAAGIAAADRPGEDCQFARAP